MTMPTMGVGQYGGYKYESAPSRALRTVSTEEYSRVYRDQGKLMSKMIGDITYMAAYMRKMQKGIDQANENFIQQIQDLINDIVVLLGGGGDTGFDFGDLKYFFQGIGALFGFADEDGNLKIPVNLFEAAWHFFSTYIIPTGNFTEVINMGIDSAIAGILDVFGEVPILGQALQQLAVIITTIRDSILPIFEVLNDVMDFLGGAPFGDPSFDLWGAVNNFIQNILHNTGKIFTEWDLLGYSSVGGMAFPISFPGTFGYNDTSLLSPLRHFINNLLLFLGSDFTTIGFNLVAAVEEFINTQLLPSGLFAAFSDIQKVIEAVAGNIGATISDIVTRLQHLDLFGGFDASRLFNILNIPALHDISVPGLQDIKNAIWEAINRVTGSNILLSDIITALRNMPPINILGVGGPINILESFQATWDQLVGGFVGAIGSGSVLPDLFNVIQEISSRASLGMFSFDILGIRNNKSFESGFLSSSESNFKYSKVALGSTSMPTFPVTQSTAITAYQRISEENDIGVVSFEGFGVSGLTSAFLNIFKMDTTTGICNKVHESSNILGFLSNTLDKTRYELPIPIHVKAGEVYGREVAVRGTGAYNIVGLTVASPPDPDVFPRNWSSVRNSGTSPPPASFTPTYATNVPFMEMGVSIGDPGAPHSPQKQFFQSVGTITLSFPSWANIGQVIAVGPGGGGRQGGTFGFNGDGGRAGQWATAIWTRGIDFTGTPTITIVIPPGGSGGSSGLGSGGNGGSTTVSIPGRSITALGGLGGTGLSLGNANAYGRSPGTLTVDGIPYAGGIQQNTSGADGIPVGGGGAGGNDILFQPGGNGAHGGVWIRFKSN